MVMLPKARVPEGLRLYAIGDVHGRLDLLEAVHDQITADLGTPCGTSTPARCSTVGPKSMKLTNPGTRVPVGRTTRCSQFLGTRTTSGT